MYCLFASSSSPFPFCLCLSLLSLSPLFQFSVALDFLFLGFLLNLPSFVFRTQIDSPIAILLISERHQDNRGTDCLPGAIEQRFGDEIVQSLNLMDCFPSSSCKKTLKRWFFIDKRVG